jgi:hypothetical protein
MVEKKEELKLNTSNFINEKSGNIKDFYKITSCIGKGMILNIYILSKYRCLWRSKKVYA